MADSLDLRNITKFDGNNFQLWKFQVRSVLVASGLLDVVNGTDIKPEGDTVTVGIGEAWNRRNAKAMYVISSSLEYSQLEYLITCDTAKDMWQKLCNIHEQKSETNKLLLMTKFHDYRMSLNDSVAQHIAKVENMARQLRDVGEVISDITIMAKILGSLPSKFNAFITAWDNVDAVNQTVQILTTRLLKEESRMSAMDDVTGALSTTSISKQNYATKKFQKKIHKPANNAQDKHQKKKNIPQQGGSRQMANVECYYCHKNGHVIANC